MKFELGGAPHIPAPVTVTWTMGQVLISLIPGVLAHLVWFGPGILFHIAIAVAAGLAFEAMMLRLRKQPVHQYLGDLSVVVTAVLFALCLPHLLPWWATVIGMFFAVVVAKHLYGGLGFNVFNPAMIGFVVVLVSFPLQSTLWLPPQSLSAAPLGFGDTLYTILTGSLPGDLTWDSITRATPLDLSRAAFIEDIMTSEVRQDPIFGRYGGVGWESIAFWYGVGGVYLIYRRVVSWHAPVAMIGTVVALTLPFYLVDPFMHPAPLAHVMTGGTVLCAFYIATDPVSGCVSPRGRLIFGVGVAVLGLSIRRWGGYPDGMAFAVLLMNMAAPLIDRYTRTRTYGR